MKWSEVEWEVRREEVKEEVCVCLLVGGKGGRGMVGDAMGELEKEGEGNFVRWDGTVREGEGRVGSGRDGCDQGREQGKLPSVLFPKGTSE